MSLVSLCCYDTEKNGRSYLTDRTLRSLAETVEWQGKYNHRLIVCDNGSVAGNRAIYEYWQKRIPGMKVIYLGENLGTARGINRAWMERRAGEKCIKMDSDCVVNEKNWVDLMEEAIDHGEISFATKDGKEKTMPLGIVAAKRKDLDENPDAPVGSWQHSTLRMLKREKGERWIPIEVVDHTLGTLQMYNPKLLDRIGYLFQIGRYSYDDNIAAGRCQVAGFYNAFLPQINIDHIDKGGTEYTVYKQKYAGIMTRAFNDLCKAYANGKSPYCGPMEEQPSLTESEKQALIDLDLEYGITK